MRRRVAMTAVLAVALGLAACGSETASDRAPDGGADDASTGATDAVAGDAPRWPSTDAGRESAPDAPAEPDSAMLDALGDTAEDTAEHDADPNPDAVDMNEVDVVGLGASRPDVVTWPKTAELRSMNIHLGTHYSPEEGWYFQIDADGYTSWPAYKPYGGENDTPVVGNIWILVRQPGSTRWWAAPIEGLVDFTDIHPAANLNFEHTNVLEGTPMASPWQPQSGEVYGWMLSTNVAFPGSNGEERSNVILEAWP